MNFVKNALCTMSLAAVALTSSAQTVTVDNYFNNETKQDKSGNKVSFHYLWEDTQASGFSILGDAFKAAGAKKLNTLRAAPTAENLKGTDVYLIVDPDNLKDNPSPNFVTEQNAAEIAKWVKAGGVLMLFANDQVNCDLEHFNILANKFGITFNKDLVLHVVDDPHFSDGALNTTGVTLFKTAKRVFLKDVCSMTIQKPGQSVLKDKNGANVLVSAKYGKGSVLAVGDPWLYNEYVNGRLPAEYENDKAANDIAAWLIEQIPAKK
ncbi:DUF4350 domain-containing protein [Pedobacter sp. MW01-1-1]|uniref:DUF4350 domain-containing protein n=1 Tax=Pedobacter sp. MW01-1-1 TaxID=3383027 RepID=UPI003FF0CD0D